MDERRLLDWSDVAAAIVCVVAGIACLAFGGMGLEYEPRQATTSMFLGVVGFATAHGLWRRALGMSVWPFYGRRTGAFLGAAIFVLGGTGSQSPHAVKIFLCCVGLGVFAGWFADIAAPVLFARKARTD